MTNAAITPQATQTISPTGEDALTVGRSLVELYHITSRTNLASIKRDGLRPDPPARSGTLAIEGKLRAIHGCCPVFLAKKEAKMLRIMASDVKDPVCLKVTLSENITLLPDLTTLSYHGGWIGNHDWDGSVIDPYIYPSNKDWDRAFHDAFHDAFGRDQVPVSEFLIIGSPAYEFASRWTGCFVVTTTIPPSSIVEVPLVDHKPNQDEKKFEANRKTEAATNIEGPTAVQAFKAMMVKTVNLPMFGRRHTDSFKTIEPDRIQERFENHHQGRLKTEEVTNIVRAILKRYVDHAAKYLPDLRLKPGKTVTYGNLLGRDRREDTEAEALKTAQAKHPDIFVPLTERVREKNDASKVAGEQAQRDVATKPVPFCPSPNQNRSNTTRGLLDWTDDPYSSFRKVAFKSFAIVTETFRPAGRKTDSPVAGFLTIPSLR